MAPPPPPPPGSGEPGKDSPAATTLDTHRSLPTPFLTKTYQLVEDSAIDDIISWNEDGSTFVVWRPAEFARDLLPKYFKHNNFSSFVRQLNTYGFRKIVPDRWEFANDCFKRGEKRLLSDIHRRKNNPLPTAAAALVAAAQQAEAVPLPDAPHPGGGSTDRVDVSPPNSTEETLGTETPPSTSSPSAAVAAAMAAATATAPTAPSTSSWSAAASTVTADLIDENERLRKENLHLNQELSQMKSLCNNILLLMSNYATRSQGAPTGSGPGSATEPRKDVLELMPLRCSSSDDSSQETMDRAKPEESGSGASPMLFGVHIGVKRLRVVDEPDGSGSSNGPDSCSGEDYQQQRQQLPHKMVTDVKSEQLDGGVSDGEEPSSDSRWLSCGRG